MKSVLLLAASALLLFTTAEASKDKSKHKEKSFEPAASSVVAALAGHYVGIQSSFWVDVQVGQGDRLEAALYENGSRVELRDLECKGAHLQATKVLGDGTTVPFQATFGTRRVNEDSAFGLLVEGNVHLEGNVVLSRLFYRRQ